MNDIRPMTPMGPMAYPGPQDQFTPDVDTSFMAPSDTPIFDNQESGHTGYSSSPDAAIAFAEQAYKNATSRQDRRAAFNDAFRAARQAGMQEFLFNGMKYAVKLANAKAAVAGKIAQTAVAEVEKGRGIQTGETKMQHDTKEALSQMYRHIQSQVHTAVPLNTLPVPEDVREREAIGNAYEGATNAYAGTVGLASLATAPGAIANRVAQWGRLAEGDANFMTNRSLDNLMGVFRDRAFTGNPAGKIDFLSASRYQ